jgi:hypothetical protein
MTAIGSDSTLTKAAQNLISLSNQQTILTTNSSSKMDPIPPITEMSNLAFDLPSHSNPRTEDEDQPTTKTTIEEIKANKPLWYKLHVYIYDLKTFAK